MTRTRTPGIRVRCPTCGIRTVGVDDLGFTHDGGIITGWCWRCPSCGRPQRAGADPALLGLLHAVGVKGLAAEASAAVTTEGDAAPELDHRAIVSLRILLDDPAVLARLAEAPRGRRAPIRPTPPG